MKSAVIIDDEEQAISALSREIELFVPELKVEGAARNFKDAILLIERVHPEIVFLDIQMDEGLGFDLLKQLNFHDFHLIFTTAYSNYAIDAFKVDAFDYLMKPVSGEDILSTLQRIDSKKSTSPNVTGSKLVISETGNKKLVSFSDIIHVQAVGNYSRIVIVQSKPLLIPYPLKSLAAKCPDSFIRCHKSHLVNAQFVDQYDSKNSVLVLKNGFNAPVSLRRKSEVNKLFC